MASSALNRKSRFHVRSNSLPSRPHPLVSQIHEHIFRLSSTEAISSSISNSINGLTDLYDLVNSFLLLPHTQQILAQECNEKQVDEVLDGSLRLMDVCNTTKDALLQIKENTQELESILRRRRGDESRVANEVGEYLGSRKKANRAIRKSLKDLKSSCSFIDHETLATVSLLRQVEGVALTVFESLFSYISGTKTHPQPCGWSFLSKLVVRSKLVSFEENDATESNEFEKVDTGLYTLIAHKTRNSSNNSAENALNVLGKLESSIQDLEEGLEILGRRLIETRMAMLNVINH